MSKPFNLLLLATIVVAFGLAGCSTIPKVTSPTGVDVSVKAMSSSEVRTYYGSNTRGDPNPFIPAGGIITHQTQDYIVVRIQIAAARKAEIKIDGITAEDSSGNTVAEPYSLDRFKANLKSWYQTGRELDTMLNRAERAYLPGDSFEVGPGRVSYVIVLVGKHPMPDPVEVKAGVTVGLEKPRLFTFEAKAVSTGGIF